MSVMPLTWSEVDDEAPHEHDSYTHMEELLLSSGMVGPLPEKPISQDVVFLEKYNRHLETTTEEAHETAAVLRVVATDLKTGELRRAVESSIKSNDGQNASYNERIEKVEEEEDSDDLFGDDDDLVTEMMRKRLEAFSYGSSSSAQSSRENGVLTLGGGKFDEVTPESFEEDVKTASKHGLVIMLIYRERSPGCDIMLRILSRLAAKCTSVKFTRMKASKAISNFPEEHCPTVMCYKKGEVVKQYVRLVSFHGSSTTADDVEWALFNAGLVESDLSEDPREAAMFN